MYFGTKNIIFAEITCIDKEIAVNKFFIHEESDVPEELKEKEAIEEDSQQDLSETFS